MKYIKKCNHSCGLTKIMFNLLFPVGYILPYVKGKRILFGLWKIIKVGMGKYRIRVK